MSTFLAGLAGAVAGQAEVDRIGIKSAASSAQHAGRMAEIAADNATAAANNAARLAKDAFDAAIQSAANGKMAVEVIGQATNEYIMPAIAENASSIAALTDLVKADIQQNKGISARLDRIEQQLKSQFNQAE